MADKIDINTVLPSSARLNAKEQSTVFHWRLSVVVASLLILASFFACWYVVLVESQHLESYREKAWFLILTLTSGAGGFLFGKIADAAFDREP